MKFVVSGNEYLSEIDRNIENIQRNYESDNIEIDEIRDELDNVVMRLYNISKHLSTLLRDNDTTLSNPEDYEFFWNIADNEVNIYYDAYADYVSVMKDVQEDEDILNSAIQQVKDAKTQITAILRD